MSKAPIIGKIQDDAQAVDVNDPRALLVYLRNKINQLLDVMGTLPLRAEELDDNSIIAVDPIGIIAESFRQIIDNQNDVNRQLKIANDEISEILNAAGAAIIVTDRDLHIEICNKLALDLMKPTEQGVLGSRLCSSIIDCPFDYENAVMDKYMLAGKRSPTVEVKINDDIYDLKMTPIWVDGELIKIIFVFFNVTERKQTLEQLRLSAAVFANTGEGVLITDAANHIVDVNDAFLRISGYQREELLGNDPNVLKSGMHEPEFYRELWRDLNTKGTWSGEIWDRRKNGEVFPVWQTINMIRRDDGTISNYISVLSDISVLKQSQEKLDFLAHHDPLTTLPNRVLFNDRLSQAIEKSKRQKTKLVIFFIDLDRFKNINDSLGHAIGDKLLVEAARRLLSNVRKSDTVARLGGDEFIILLDDFSSTEHTGYLADKLIKSFNEPFKVGHHELHLSLSIGICLYPDDGNDVNTLVKNADAAMYRAKEQGRNGFQFFTEELSRKAFEKLTIETNLRRAIEQDQLQLYYQPQNRLNTGEIIAAEILLRWRHPELGMIPPDKFIPVAEETGLIVPIGDWVISQACRQLHDWRTKGYDIGYLAINISGVQLQRGDIVRHILRTCDYYQLSVSDLELEITESILMEDAEVAVRILTELQKQGASIAIDDFGTGYSSLGYLKHLPVDKLKIDRDFIRDINSNADDEAIVKAIIAMASNLQLTVIAEGVEDLAHCEILRQYKCNIAQGYYFSRPLPAQEFEELLKPLQSDQKTEL